MYELEENENKVEKKKKLEKWFEEIVTTLTCSPHRVDTHGDMEKEGTCYRC